MVLTCQLKDKIDKKKLTYFLIGINRLDVKGWKTILQVKKSESK